MHDIRHERLGRLFATAVSTVGTLSMPLFLLRLGNYDEIIHYYGLVVREAGAFLLGGSLILAFVGISALIFCAATDRDVSGRLKWGTLGALLLIVMHFFFGAPVQVV